MSQQREAALWLAAQGFRVFPLKPRGKTPAIDGFPIAATTDVNQINSWWSANPEYNIGVCTTGFVVVDVDTKKGPHAEANFEANGGDKQTFTVRTPTGGWHYYYQGPDSALAVDTPAPGLDVRSHNGYVVGPGSVTEKGTYTLERSDTLAPLPVLFEIALKPPGQTRTREELAERDKAHNIELAKAFLQTAPVAIEGAGGNQTTYQVAARLVRDYALTVETAYSLLALEWNDKCIPPWTNDDLWRITQNADAYGTSDLGKRTPDAVFGAVPEIPPAPPALEQSVVQAYHVNGARFGNALPVMNQRARPWKVERLLMTGEVTVLGGVGSAGKSMLELACAAHFALGRDFGTFKLKEKRPHRMMMYNGEDDIEEQSRRLAAVCAQYQLDYDTVSENIMFMDDRNGELILVAADRNVPKYVDANIQAVVDLARSNAVDIIIVDPLANIHACNENDNMQMRFVITACKNIARATNTAFMLAHHTGKGGALKEKGDAESFRGASAIINSARIALLMSGPTKDDAQIMGIRDTDRKQYIRLDVGKANLFGPQGNALAWLKWNTVRHPAGDLIGVPVLQDMRQRQSDAGMSILQVIKNSIREQGRSYIGVMDAVLLCVSNGLATPGGGATREPLRKYIVEMIGEGVEVEGDTLYIKKEDRNTLIMLA